MPGCSTRAGFSKAALPGRESLPPMHVQEQDTRVLDTYHNKENPCCGFLRREKEIHHAPLAKIKSTTSASHQSHLVRSTVLRFQARSASKHFAQLADRTVPQCKRSKGTNYQSPAHPVVGKDASFGVFSSHSATV